MRAHLRDSDADTEDQAIESKVLKADYRLHESDFGDVTVVAHKMVEKISDASRHERGKKYSQPRVALEAPKKSRKEEEVNQ